MIPVETARAETLSLVSPLPAETIPLAEALGRGLAAPVTAGLTQPPFDASSMDGYWVAEGDLIPGARLQVIGESAAGKGFAGQPGPGQAIRIFTGAPCPAGGRVVIQEDVTRDGDAVILPAPLSDARNIRLSGQDFSAGDSFFPEHLLTPRDIGLIAAMNVPQVNVHRRPNVAVIVTGDELVEPGSRLGEGQIVSANGLLLAAMIREAGAIPRLLPIARDSEESLRATFRAAADADLIVTSGGVSVGDHDLVGKVAGALGLERRFWKISMRPGKPLMAGRMGGSVLLGLPGNPVSSAVTAKIFLLPMIRKMLGDRSPAPAPLQAVLAADVGPTGPRTHFMRATLRHGGALPLIAPFESQDSALLRILAEADALLIRPLDDGPRKAGETVLYLPL